MVLTLTVFMPIKNKIQKIQIAQKTFIYRYENNYFWLYCPQQLEFYRFNKDGFAVLLYIDREKVDTEIATIIKKNKKAQAFLAYLVGHEIVNEKNLRKSGLL